MTLTRPLCAAALLVTLAPPAQAAKKAKDPIYTAMTADQTAAIVEAAGHSVTRKTLDGGQQIHVFELNGIRTSMYHYNCDAQGACASLQLYAGFAMAEKPSLETINEWNRSKRLTRAYLDSDRDPCLESDLSLAGGVSEGAVTALLSVFQTSTGMFMDHVGFQR